MGDRRVRSGLATPARIGLSYHAAERDPPARRHQTSPPPLSADGLLPARPLPARESARSPRRILTVARQARMGPGHPVCRSIGTEPGVHRDRQSRSGPELPGDVNGSRQNRDEDSVTRNRVSRVRSVPNRSLGRRERGRWEAVRIRNARGDQNHIF
jgi:hypothetical protein